MELCQGSLEFIITLPIMGFKIGVLVLFAQSIRLFLMTVRPINTGNVDKAGQFTIV